MRSGAFSIGEPRSSTKGVRTGAGRARRCRIQALSTAAGCAADGSAITANSSASSAHFGHLRVRCRVTGLPCPGLLSVGHAVLLASAVLKVAPEVVEVEPVE